MARLEHLEVSIINSSIIDDDDDKDDIGCIMGAVVSSEAWLILETKSENKSASAAAFDHF